MRQECISKAKEAETDLMLLRNGDKHADEKMGIKEDKEFYNLTWVSNDDPSFTIRL